ncbi:hypothetical protein AC028_00890 [Xanthomonas citri pv. aurantifolii]|nr:hypothetical protein AC028_00890 [Xanthomonas citri pv. aurantifolii]
MSVTSAKAASAAFVVSVSPTRVARLVKACLPGAQRARPWMRTTPALSGCRKHPLPPTLRLSRSVRRTEVEAPAVGSGVLRLGSPKGLCLPTCCIAGTPSGQAAVACCPRAIVRRHRQLSKLAGKVRMIPRRHLHCRPVRAPGGTMPQT